MTETILVADNEPDILRFVEVNLRVDGYDVITVADGEAALQTALDRRPSLVILDVMMPGLDGFEVCRRLRADARTSHIPIIMLTARSLTEDKVLGLSAGADDYMVKPFDPVELVARVTMTLRRNAELRAVSPLTGLPGNHSIGVEIERRLADGGEVAVIYADLKDFKSYNDRYGFVRGDEVIALTAEVLRDALTADAEPSAFLGHIGGDDFVAVCDAKSAEPVCERAVPDFDARIRDRYDEVDLAAGGVTGHDRQGHVTHHPIVALALGVATTRTRPGADRRLLVQVATEMKTFAKSRPGSGYAVDHRAL